MGYASLLVEINEFERREAVMALALDLARTFTARLTALHLYVPSHLSELTYADSLMWGEKRALEREHEQATERDAARKREFVRLAQKYQPVTTAWRFDSGGVARTLALHGRYADLVIMGQCNPGESNSRSGFDTPAEVALLSARPILVLPSDGPSSAIGRRVLVAWNASRESTRAVTAALPFLKQAQAVDVVVVDPDSVQKRLPGEEAGTEITRYLAHHGVETNLTRLSRGALHVSEVLQSMAAEKGADLLCMGVYGHSRLREFVFGGVSRDLMRHMIVPTLIAC